MMGEGIEAERERIWAAISDPSEVARWRPGVEGIGSPGASFPTEGRRFEWLCRLNDIPIKLIETPIRVVDGARIESEIRFGLFRFLQTLSISKTSSGYRVLIQIETPNRMSLVGGTLDRFAVRRFATELAATYLQAIRDWCERDLQRPSTSPETGLGPRALVNVSL